MIITTSEDIQYYMNQLQKDEWRKDILRSDNYATESKVRWIRVDDVKKLLAKRFDVRENVHCDKNLARFLDSSLELINYELSEK